MTNSQAIILGVVQGLTEYLPVSSSAHLVLVPHVLGWQFSPKESFVFDVLVQLGTLFGVLVYFFNPLRDIVLSVIKGLVTMRPFHETDARLGWLVALSSIPAAVIGLAFKDMFLEQFSSPVASCYFLIVTGLLLAGAEYFSRIRRAQPTAKDAWIIGFAQSIALLPGISRSGATIAAGLSCGLSRKDAARFSFLMSIPVMLGAGLVVSSDLWGDRALIEQLAVPLTLGFFTAAFTGYLVIKWFMAFVSSQKLSWFAVYCIVVGFFGVFYFA